MAYLAEGQIGRKRHYGGHGPMSETNAGVTSEPAARLAHIVMRYPGLDLPALTIEKLAIEKPLREGRCLLLMLALAEAGQQVRALRHYATLRTLLRDELGLAPDRRLQDMEHRILTQDPTLGEIDPLSLVFC